MLYDTVVAEARRNDPFDDVRAGALARARWLVDLLERQRAEFAAGLHGVYTPEQSHTRDAVLSLLLAACLGDTLWQYVSEIDSLVSRVRGWTPAEVRREVLERILPRLRIADRCSIAGRWLSVRGDLCTYRIHLGSANILMEPDDSYLCIVPARRRTEGTVFLPFEDDRLSLILSKAHLLAADTKISDETILRQIKRGG